MNRSKWCGPVEKYDYMGAWQFSILWKLGIRHYNTLLDYGCGSLRLGRFMIQYLDEDNYYGIEPNAGLLKEGIEQNYLTELIKKKGPNFRHSDDCDMGFFGMEFDYIIAHSVLTHMPRKQIEKTFETAYRVMHKGTIFIANFHHGPADYKGEKWTQKIVQFTPQTIDQLITASGLHSTPLHLVPNHLQTWLQIRK